MNEKIKEVIATQEGLVAMLQAHERSFGTVVNSEESIAHLEEVFSTKEKESKDEQEK